MERSSADWFTRGCLLSLAAAFFSSLVVGGFSISVCQLVGIVADRLSIGGVGCEFGPQHEAVLLHVRLPRTVLAMAVGGALGAAGAAMQGLFRNPLADPSLIGVSSGATVAAVASIILGARVGIPFDSVFGGLWLELAAFAGALVTTLFVYALGRRSGAAAVATMLLTGIAVNALAEAATGSMIYAADDDQLRTVTFWRLGSLASASWRDVQLTVPVVVVALVLLFRVRVALNAFALGEAQADFLGIDVEHVKRLVLVGVSAGVGASVAVSGLIGFVGLAVPHIVRRAIGPEHGRLLVASALLGAAILLVADIAARTIVLPSEMPIGILTAAFGAPLLLYMLQNSAMARRSS